MWGHCVASSEANDLKICFAKIQSLFKTSEKICWLKRFYLGKTDMEDLRHFYGIWEP